MAGTQLLPKFGRCKAAPKGVPEPGFTRVDEKVELHLGFEKKLEVKQVSALDTLGKGFKVVCRNCQENHLTFKCPYPIGQAPQGKAPIAEEEPARGAAGASTSSSAAAVT